MFNSHVFFSVEDVVIQVVRWLCVRDALAFVSTCCTLRQLQETKAFWLHIIAEIARRRPLPMPPWELPQDRTTSALRTLAQQAYQIRRVLSSGTPLPVVSSRSSLPAGFVMHTVISATNLVLVHNSSAGTLACVNLKTGWCSPVVSAGAYLLNESDIRISGESTMIAFQTGTHDFAQTRSTTLRCYTLSCREGAESLTQTWMYTIEQDPHPGRGQDIFLDRDIMGFITARDNREVRIQAWNMRTMHSVEFSFASPIPNDARLLVQASCIIERQLCLNFVYQTETGGLGMVVASFAHHTLPYQEDAESGVDRQLRIVSSSTLVGQDLSFVSLSHSPLRHWSQTLATFAAIDEGDARLQITSLAYSPLARNSEHMPHDLLALEYFGYNIAANAEWVLLAWDGPTLVFVMQDVDDEHLRHLVFVQLDHPDPQKPRNAGDVFTLAKPEHPDEVNLNSVNKILVDGRLGIVYLQIDDQVHNLCYA